MRKAHLLFTLLLALAFLTACTNETKTLVPQEPIKNTPIETTNQTNESIEPPVTVQPSVLPDKTTFSKPIPNVENAVINKEKNSITIKFVNNKNATISLPLTGSVSKNSKSVCDNPQITATYKGNYVTSLVTEIKNGEEFTVTWDCENLKVVPASGTLFSADLVFNYKSENGMIYQESGTVVGQY
jgi:hypothetical protein